MAQSRAKALSDVLAQPRKPVSKEDAISIVAELAYPNDPEPAAAKKRVRERFRYGYTGPWPANPGEFFEWASKQWPRLAAVKGLPRNNTVDLDIVRAASAVQRLTPIHIPPDRAGLEEAYIGCETNRQDLEVEVRELKARIRHLEGELGRTRRRRSELRAKLSEAGKKGGRGKER